MKWRNEVKYQLHCADYSCIYPPGAATLQIQVSLRELWCDLGSALMVLHWVAKSSFRQP